MYTIGSVCVGLQNNQYKTTFGIIGGYHGNPKWKFVFIICLDFGRKI